MPGPFYPADPSLRVATPLRDTSLREYARVPNFAHPPYGPSPTVRVDYREIERRVLADLADQYGEDEVRKMLGFPPPSKCALERICSEEELFHA